VNFTLGDERFSLDVDPEIGIRDLKLLVARELHIDFALVLLAGGSEVDDDMYLCDIEDIPELVIHRVPDSVRAATSVSVAEPEQPTLISRFVKDFRGMTKIRGLGSGKFGVVDLVEDPLTHEEIALKSFNEADEGRDMTVPFMREIDMLIRLSHPCLIRIVGYSLPTADLPAQIGMEFAANGSLRNVLDKRESGSAPAFLDDTGIAMIVSGIVLGMNFVHCHGGIHCDLKPENILLDAAGRVKIGDLSSSRLADAGVALSAEVGTPFYMAPELYDDKEYTAAVDVYAFALMLYEILNGHPVWPRTLTPAMLMKRALDGTRPPLPDAMNVVVKEIICRGWALDPAQRGSFADILSDLERIAFQSTAAVDPSKVAEYVAWVRRHEAQ
jgi:serine/threonine protein kinase